MYTDVAVGIDGTDAGRDALALALTLAPGAAHLALAHVRVLEAPALRGDSAAFAVKTREDSVQLLSAERDRAAVRAELLNVLAADVGSGLHDVAESRGADLLVVGSSQRSAVGRVLVGETARAVINRAPCAVAVAPHGYRMRVKTLEVIGVAYDDSAQSEVALAHAQALSAQTGARVVARQVVEPKANPVGVFAAPPPVDAERDSGRAGESVGILGGGDMTVVVGTSGRELTTFSETVDVLICGSRHSGMIRRVALGSTTDYLTRRCACPLIITTAMIREPAGITPVRLARA
jgi:nucleotide-binding universal stress UspA family protein